MQKLSNRCGVIALEMQDEKEANKIFMNYSRRNDMRKEYISD